MISTVAYDTELIQPSYDQIETMTFSHLHGEVYKGSYDEKTKANQNKSSPVRTLVKGKSLKVKCLQGSLIQIDEYRTTACKEQAWSDINSH